MQIDDFLKEKNIILNKQQRNAVENTEGKILLLAVPGSGKTTVIVTRIGYMVKVKKVAPQNILTLTYSVSAARDMKARYEALFGEEKALQFRTIHSFCVMVLKEFERQSGRKSFDLIRNTNEVLAQLYLQIQHDFPNDAILKEIMTQITYCKNGQLSKEEIKEIENENIDFYKIYKAYENYKMQNKLMDFDDQLKYAYTILKSYPVILEKFKKTYTYINIDEAQDTSKIQHEIIRLLVDKNLFMVGDEDQSIYRFRAAYPQALLDFQKQYKNAKILLMETNYRSTPQILNVANKFIKQNTKRKDKNIVPYRPSGEPIKHIIFQNIEEQYDYILKEASKTEEKLAILYRNNDSAIPLIDRFIKNKLSFTTKECDTNFFVHRIVSDIKYFIKFYFEPNNMEIFKKIYYKINCGISKEHMKKLSLEMERRKDLGVLDNLMNLEEIVYWQRKKLQNIKLEMLTWNKKNSYGILKAIFKNLEYENFLRNKKAEKTSDMQKINVLYGIAKQNSDIRDFMKRLDELEEKIKEGSRENPNVVLSTIHGSKGLEYDRVLLIDVMQGILPCVAKPESKKGEALEEYEEEVRLFYVAITRAKNKLEILSYKTAYDEFVEESTFVSAIFGDKKKELANEYKKGQTIEHKKFGKCKIIDVEPDTLIVKCKNGIKRRLNLELCLSNKLIS